EVTMATEPMETLYRIAADERAQLLTAIGLLEGVYWRECTSPSEALRALKQAITTRDAPGILRACVGIARERAKNWPPDVATCWRCRRGEHLECVAWVADGEPCDCKCQEERGNISPKQ